MACGEPHPDFILEKLTSKQLTEIIAYNSVEPFGHDTLYFMLGQLISLLYNVNKGKNHSTKGPWDFIPFIKYDNKKQDPSVIKSIFHALVEETNPNKKKTVKKEKKRTSKFLQKRLNKLKGEK